MPTPAFPEPPGPTEPCLIRPGSPAYTYGGEEGNPSPGLHLTPLLVLPTGNSPLLSVQILARVSQVHDPTAPVALTLGFPAQPPCISLQNGPIRSPDCPPGGAWTDALGLVRCVHVGQSEWSVGTRLAGLAITADQATGNCHVGSRPQRALGREQAWPGQASPPPSHPPPATEAASRCQAPLCHLKGVTPTRGTNALSVCRNSDSSQKVHFH